MDTSYLVYARMFKAMSDENRLRILDYLMEKDMTASDLLERMNFGQSTLSHHMAMLREAGLVEAYRKGKWTIYYLKKEPYQQMMNWMKRYM